MTQKDKSPVNRQEPQPIVKEVLLNAPVTKVWKAITDKNDMKKWYFDIPEFKPEVGFEFQFTGPEGYEHYIHICKITDVIVNKKLSYTWIYEGYAGNSQVTFELFEEGDKTRLKLTHEGLDSFGADNPELSRENGDEGWEYLISRAIKEFVEQDA